VTSLDGAAIRDILKVLRRRYRNVHVVIRPTKVRARRRRRNRARVAADRQSPARGRRHRRTRRRVDGGLLGVQ
jgi:exonuclease VII large subunit